MNKAKTSAGNVKEIVLVLLDSNNNNSTSSSIGGGNSSSSKEGGGGGGGGGGAVVDLPSDGEEEGEDSDDYDYDSDDSNNSNTINNNNNNSSSSKKAKKPSIQFTSENYDIREDPKYNKNGEFSLKTISCDTLRAKINLFLGKKEMTQTAFLKLINVNSSSFSRFMSYKGRFGGINNNTYWNALEYFTEREEKERLKKKEEAKREKEAEKEAMKAVKVIGKKRTVDEIGSSVLQSGKSPAGAGTGAVGGVAPISTATVTSTITTTILPSPSPSSSSDAAGGGGEGGGKRAAKAAAAEALLKAIKEVGPIDDSVYDDCDEVRAKISAFVQSDNMNMAKFAAALGVTPRAVTQFVAKRGHDKGAGSTVYYNAYLFFERYRLLKKEAKTARRLKNEKSHPMGFPLREPPKKMWVMIMN